jgi:hypothetical protein
MSSKTDYISGMCFFIPLKKLRETPSVEFDLIPGVIDGLSSIDRVRHQQGAISPSAPGTGVERPWYMHPNQEDNLIVLSGIRKVELYTKEHGKVEQFEVTPDYVKHGDKYVYEGRCIFGWPTNVFHRINSPLEGGSISINFAKHSDGFDIRTNFNIYDLDEATAEYRVIREGHKDQPNS